MPARKNVPKRKKARGFPTLQLKLSSRYKSGAITPLTNCSFAWDRVCQAKRRTVGTVGDTGGMKREGQPTRDRPLFSVAIARFF